MRRNAVIAIATAALVAIASWKCSPLYVLRAGIEESKILSRRRPISEVVEDANTSEATRRKLELVVQTRTFAERSLGLNAGESYTTYSWVDSDTLMLVLSAARKDRFEQYTWWFPIVGNVPYKGFFDFDEAHAVARAMSLDGYDTFVRPTSAFSTLGWFNDPLLNTILRYDDVALGETVIHELTHNTIFVPSQVEFNESFASFVGDRGAIVFFCQRDGATSQTCKLAQDRWHDTLLFGAHLSSLVTDLKGLYGRTDIGTPQKLELREQVFRAARERFKNEVLPRLKTRDYAGFANATLNNASLIARRLYYDRLEVFEAAFHRLGGDLPNVIKAMVEAAKESPKDPYGAISRLGLS
jgi:predicted aminopeptidase